MLDTVLGNIHAIVQRLQRKPHLKPSTETNALFGSLVNTVQIYDKDDFANVIVHYDLHCLANDTQCMCSAGEYELELWWSKQIIHSIQPQQTLKAFPYLNNYQKLVALEASLLNLSHKPAKSLFIGAGPLPLSAIVLAQDYGWEVTCLDKDPLAYEYTNQVISKLDLKTHLTPCKNDVMKCTDFKQYQVIILGGLVGTNSEEKLTILNHIYSRAVAGTKVVVRSSHGLRELLYPSIAIDQIKNWQIEKVVHPKNDLINSLIVLCKP